MTKYLITACAIVLLAQTAWSQPAMNEAQHYYLSHAEWQGAVLTENGRGIIADAAKQAKTLPMTIVDVNIWAYLSATPASQRRLADARLAAAREELLRIGVDAKDIATLVTDAPDGLGPEPQGEQIKRIVLVVHY
jgi:hypothetical protein